MHFVDLKPQTSFRFLISISSYISIFTCYYVHAYYLFSLQACTSMSPKQTWRITGLVYIGTELALPSTGLAYTKQHFGCFMLIHVNSDQFGTVIDHLRKQVNLSFFPPSLPEVTFISCLKLFTNIALYLFLLFALRINCSPEKPFILSKQLLKLQSRCCFGFLNPKQ